MTDEGNCSISIVYYTSMKIHSQVSLVPMKSISYPSTICGVLHLKSGGQERYHMNMQKCLLLLMCKRKFNGY